VDNTIHGREPQVRASASEPACQARQQGLGQKLDDRRLLGGRQGRQPWRLNRQRGCIRGRRPAAKPGAL
jgi:hypothetical protein